MAKHNNDNGGDHKNKDANANGGTAAGSASVGQPANNQPSWLTEGSGGTGAPIPVSAWLNPDYPGGYAGWLNDHPDPGHDPNPPSNPVYKAWLQQHVGSDGQLHLPPASSVNGTGGVAAPAPSPSPVAPPPASQSDGSGQDLNKILGSMNGSSDGSKGDGVDGVLGSLGKQESGSGSISQDISNVTSGGGGNGGGSIEDTLSNLGSPPASGGGSLSQEVSQITSGGSGGHNGGGIDGVLGDLHSQAPSSGSLPTSLSQLESNGSSYTVKSGDTLSGIAEKSGLSTAQLESMNPQVANPDLIHPGQLINIGSDTPKPTQPPSPLLSEVSKKGFSAGGMNVNGNLVNTVSSELPTSSTYPPTDQNKPGKLKQLGMKIKGWGNGSNVPNDPAQTITYVGGQHNTDPTHINDNNHSSHTA